MFTNLYLKNFVGKFKSLAAHRSVTRGSALALAFCMILLMVPAEALSVYSASTSSGFSSIEQDGGTLLAGTARIPRADGSGYCVVKYVYSDGLLMSSASAEYVTQKLELCGFVLPDGLFDSDSDGEEISVFACGSEESPTALVAHTPMSTVVSSFKSLYPAYNFSITGYMSLENVFDDSDTVEFSDDGKEAYVSLAADESYVEKVINGKTVTVLAVNAELQYTISASKLSYAVDGDYVSGSDLNSNADSDTTTTTSQNVSDSDNATTSPTTTTATTATTTTATTTTSTSEESTTAASETTDSNNVSSNTASSSASDSSTTSTYMSASEFGVTAGARMIGEASTSGTTSSGSDNASSASSTTSAASSSSTTSTESATASTSSTTAASTTSASATNSSTTASSSTTSSTTVSSTTTSNTKASSSTTSNTAASNTTASSTAASTKASTTAANSTTTSSSTASAVITTSANTTATTYANSILNGTTNSSDETQLGVVSTRRLPLNIRSGPGTNYMVVTVLQRGTYVTVLSTENSEWYMVKTMGKVVGYAYSRYIKLV